MSELPTILSRFRAGDYRDARNVDFTPDDLSAAAKLARNPDESFELLRLRVWYHFSRKEFALALATEREAFALRPNLESLKNIGIVARDLRDRVHAIDFMLQHEAKYAEHFEIYDVLAHNCGLFGDMAGARRYGTRALQLKDARHGGGGKPPPLPQVPAFRADRKFNVIAFSLYGENPRYVEPLLVSASIRTHLYPLWSIRVYVDDTVPGEVVRALQARECDVVRVGDSSVPGTFWRFLVADDGQIDRFIIRDADSILNVRERVAVDAWIASGKHFHMMRDFYSHTELILAGLWGGVRGAIAPMQQRIDQWLRARTRIVHNETTIDQAFLRETVWPIARHSALVHDSVFDFSPRVDFPPLGTLPPWKHVGQNDFHFFRKSKKN